LVGECLVWGHGFGRGVPPCGASHFLLLRQKKVSKEKATPGYAVGCADSPALLEAPGGCGTRLGCAKPQTVLADYSRPFSVARRSTWGPRKPSACNRRWLNLQLRSRCGGFAGPLGRRRATQALAEKGRGLSEPRSGEFRSALNDAQHREEVPLGCPRQRRVAQGTGRSPAPTQGWPFLWLLSFAHTKESTPARKAEHNGRENQYASLSKEPKKC
jgi:hypothetical protein